MPPQLRNKSPAPRSTQSRWSACVKFRDRTPKPRKHCRHLQGHRSTRSSWHGFAKFRDSRARRPKHCGRSSGLCYGRKIENDARIINRARRPGPEAIDWGRDSTLAGSGPVISVARPDAKRGGIYVSYFNGPSHEAIAAMPEGGVAQQAEAVAYASIGTRRV